MLDAGVSGYPSGQLSRTTIDSTAVDGGCVELRVSSPRNVPIAVSGHRPCERDEDCSEPLRCDVGTNTCR